jgi:hypothetical protein
LKKGANMKINKTYILTVLVLLFSFLTISTANARLAWYGNVTITSQSDIAALAGYTDINGTLTIASPTLENLDGLESLYKVTSVVKIQNNPLLSNLNGLQNLRVVGWDLKIEGNEMLLDLDGLSNLWVFGGDVLQISENASLIDLSGLYSVRMPGDYLAIFYNQVLSMSEAYDLESQLGVNGFNGTAFIGNNGTMDNDNDGIVDSEDNCINNCNTQQLDADGDGIGDVCDPDTGCDGCSSICEIEC